MSVLIVTVGGSPAPVKHAIQQNDATHVVFVCSGGRRSSVDTAREVVRELELPEERYSIRRAENPDDLADVLACCRELDTLLANRFAGHSVIANYTGGTKSMSAGLVLHGFRQGWKLQVQEGERQNMVKLEHGDFGFISDLSEVHADQAETESQALAERGDFDGAAELLERALPRLRGDVRTRLRAAATRWRLEAALERFDLEAADRYKESLHPPEARGEYGQLIGSARSCLQVLGGESDRYRSLDTFAPLRLLLDGARAAAKRARYDEAIARLYRASELLAQIQLMRKFRLRTSAVPIDELPDTWRDDVKLHDGVAKLGLRDAYRLLRERGDALGQHYGPRGQPLEDWCGYRNQSVLAHGFEPVTREKWESVGEAWLAWIDKGIEVAK